MERSDYFDEDGVVSIWLGLTKPARDERVDILRDLCGVESYDIDAQEIIAVGDFEEAPVAEILRLLSYSSSFLEAATRVAESRGIRTALWAVGQYDYAYDPSRVYMPIAADPMFIGQFKWSDTEGDTSTTEPIPDGSSVLG